jgi:hypothetical protein
MCEELEYSELLDGVSDVKDPYDRMVTELLVAASVYYECNYHDLNFELKVKLRSERQPV